jgi:hypothetical protein
MPASVSDSNAPEAARHCHTNKRRARRSLRREQKPLARRPIVILPSRDARDHSPSSKPKKTMPDATAARLHNSLMPLLTGMIALKPKASSVAHIRPLPMTGEVMCPSTPLSSVNRPDVIEAGVLMVDFCRPRRSKQSAFPPQYRHEAKQAKMIELWRVGDSSTDNRTDNCTDN